MKKNQGKILMCIIEHFRAATISLELYRKPAKLTATACSHQAEGGKNYILKFSIGGIEETGIFID
jgi:hypothetical protein